MSKRITLEAAEIRETMRAMIYSGVSDKDEIVRWTPPEASLLSKEELVKLPTPTLRLTDSGVYFLWLGTELIYIGSSENVHLRVTSHLGKMRFTAATFLAVTSPWHLAIEALYIRRYEPRINAQFLKRA